MLRDYQSEIIDDFDRLVGRGAWSVLVPRWWVHVRGAAAAAAQTVNRNSTLVGHYSEPNPPQNRKVARAAACNAAGAP
jgi:hypothetical protein